jgi:hypothetical protein
MNAGMLLSFLTASPSFTQALGKKAPGHILRTVDCELSGLGSGGSPSRPTLERGALAQKKH